MNNTEKLDSIKHALRRIETRRGIIQRTNVIMFERITGGAFPQSWVSDCRNCERCSLQYAIVASSGAATGISLQSATPPHHARDVPGGQAGLPRISRDDRKISPHRPGSGVAGPVGGLGDGQGPLGQRPGPARLAEV